jgi:hypothetical protein
MVAGQRPGYMFPELNEDQFKQYVFRSYKKLLETT